MIDDHDISERPSVSVRSHLEIAGQRVARRGCLFIVSGPSGAGKTSLCTPALAALQGIKLSVSFTTRQARAGEVDGEDYHYIDDSRFDRMLVAGEFAEWAEVHGHRYATARSTLDDALGSGQDLLLDIDVQGAGQIKAAYAEAVAVFLLPPSRERLEKRLRGRGTDSEETVRKRLRNACGEIAGLIDYDYAIVNDDLKTALEEFLSIVRVERRRVERLNRADLERLLLSFND